MNMTTLKDIRSAQFLGAAIDAVRHLGNYGDTEALAQIAGLVTEQLQFAVTRGLYDLVALAFGTSREDSKKRLLAAMYGGRGTPVTSSPEPEPSA